MIIRPHIIQSHIFYAPPYTAAFSRKYYGARSNNFAWQLNVGKGMKGLHVA